MPTGHVFIATSLDGFIARADGSLDWLLKQAAEGEDHGYDAFIDSVDGVVMGRGSFEKVVTFAPWPYPKPVIVMSSVLTDADIPARLRSRVNLSRLTPRALMADLASRGWQRAYIDGGRLIRSFLREGLIADITLTRAPVLIGHGRPLFGDLPRDIELEHVSTRSFPSGLVTSVYRIR